MRSGLLALGVVLAIIGALFFLVGIIVVSEYGGTYLPVPIMYWLMAIGGGIAAVIGFALIIASAMKGK